MPNQIESEREWGRDVALRYLDGEISLKKVTAYLRGVNLTRTEFVRLILSAGKFEIMVPIHGDECLYGEQQAKTAERLERLILDRDLGLSAVNYLWDTVDDGVHTQWKEAVCHHFSPNGLYALLMTEPSDAFRHSRRQPLPESFASHVPAEKQVAIAALAQQYRKLSALYKITGWEACRALARGTDRDSMMGADLGL